MYLLSIQDTKCFEFTVHILPPPPWELKGKGKFCASCIFDPQRFISVYALDASVKHFLKLKLKEVQDYKKIDLKVYLKFKIFQQRLQKKPVSHFSTP